MKRILLRLMKTSNPTKTKNMYIFLFVVVFTLCFSITNRAQCGLGPYQGFEGFGLGPTAAGNIISMAQVTNLSQGGIWYGANLNPLPTANSGLGGTKSLTFGRALPTATSAFSSYLITPKITSPSKSDINLSFFYRGTTSATALTFRVDYILASSFTPSVGFDPTSVTWTPLYTSGSLLVGSPYQYLSVTVPGLSVDTIGGVYFKITRTSGNSNLLVIDNLAWASANNSENTVYNLPTTYSPGSTADCGSVTSGVGTSTLNATLLSNKSYSFYDNGGVNDNHHFNQASTVISGSTHTVTFYPATGENLSLFINNFVSGGSADGALSVTDGTNTISTYTGSYASLSTKTFNSCSSITVTYKTTGTTGAGFDMTVTSSGVPTSFAVTPASITSNAASFTWSSCSTPSGGFDYYISQSSTNPSTLYNTSTAITTSNTSSVQANTTTNASSITISGFLGGTTYYGWIRSNYGTSYSAWIPLNSTTFTTLCSPLIPPYIATFTGAASGTPASNCNQSCIQDVSTSYNIGSLTNNYVLTSANNAYLVITPLTLTAGLTYSLSVDIAATGGSVSFSTKYATSVAGASTGTLIFSNSTSNTSLTNFSGNFTVASTGTYYIGIAATTISGTNYKLNNIKVDVVCGNKTYVGPSTYTSNANYWSPVGIPTVNDNLIFNSDYTGPGNSTLSGCSCTVTSGNVIFSSGDVLSLVGIVTVSGGSLTFNNNSSLIQITTATNSGNITYNRNSNPVRKYDYTYWSSPVAGCTLSSAFPTTGTNVFFQYSGLIQNWQYVDPSSTTMGVGQGYIVRAPNSYAISGNGQVYTAPFTGVPTNGDKQVLIYGNNKLNLIGNPYPSAISALSLVTDPSNSGTLGGTLYFWTHSYDMVSGQYNASDYATWTSGGGTVTGGGLVGANTAASNGKIGAGQAFFVSGIATSNKNITFTNSMRLSGTSDNSFFYKNSNQPNQNVEQPKSRIWLDVTNSNGVFKQLLVAYIEGATSGIDRLYDGEFIDVGLPMVIYTKAANTKLTIQGVGFPFQETDTFPIVYKAINDGTFTFNLSNYDGLFTNQNIYLEDTVLHTITDLKQGTYTFTTLAGTYEDRFILRFNTTTALAVNHSTFDSNAIVVYKNQDGLHINSGVIDMDKVKIYDLSGRLITEKNAIQAVDTIFTNLPASPQILLVQITSVDGVTVTKKIGY